MGVSTPKKLATIGLLLLLAISVITAAAVLPWLATRSSTAETREAALLGIKISEAFSDVLENTSSAILAVVGNTLGYELTLPAYSTPHIETFRFIASRMSPWVPAGNLFLAPDAIVDQVYPDLTSTEKSPIDLRRYGFIPPTKASSLKANSSTFDVRTIVLTDATYIVKTAPIFSNADPDQHFWGYAGAMISMDSLVDLYKDELQRSLSSGSYLVVTPPEPNATEVVLVVSSVFNHSATQKELFEYIFASVAAPIVDSDHIVGTVYTRHLKKTRHQMPFFWKMCSVLCGVTAVFFVAFRVFLWSAGTNVSRRQVPQTPPFAMLIVGLRNADDLWNLVSDEMNEADEAFRRILLKFANDYDAYQVTQLKHHTASFFLETVDDAIQMAFGVIDAALAKSIDASLVELLGNDGHLDVSCAIHWCNEAEAIVWIEEVQYRGADVLYSYRLFQAAVGNAVTISRAAKLSVSCLPQEDFCAFTPYSRGEHLHGIFYVIDRKSERMRSAFMDSQFRRCLSPSSDDEEASGNSFNYLGIHRKGFTRRQSKRSVRSSNQLPPNSEMMPSDEMERQTGGPHAMMPWMNHPVSATPAVNTVDEFPSTAPANLFSHDASSQTDGLAALRTSGVPKWLDRTLRKAFEEHCLSTKNSSATPVFSVTIYYFYFGYALLFQPLSPNERKNIVRCLATAFGVSDRGFFEYLAVRCAIEFNESGKKS